MGTNTEHLERLAAFRAVFDTAVLGLMIATKNFLFNERPLIQHEESEEKMSTAQDIAQWMLNCVKNNSEVYQEDIVYDIQREFGSEWVYENENGNLAINKNILNEFRKISKDLIVWERGEKCWRIRTLYDSPGRQQG